MNTIKQEMCENWYIALSCEFCGIWLKLDYLNSNLQRCKSSPSDYPVYNSLPAIYLDNRTVQGNLRLQGAE